MQCSDEKTWHPAVAGRRWFTVSTGTDHTHLPLTDAVEQTGGRTALNLCPPHRMHSELPAAGSRGWGCICTPSLSVSPYLLHCEHSLCMRGDDMSRAAVSHHTYQTLACLQRAAPESATHLLPPGMFLLPLAVQMDWKQSGHQLCSRR